MSKCWYKKPGKQGRCESDNTRKCESKVYYCSKESKGYHTLCDRIWNVTDESLRNKTIEDLESLEEDATVCIFMRERHTDICIHPECRDSGHLGTIKRIRDKIRIIKHSKYSKESSALLDQYLAGRVDISEFVALGEKYRIPLIFPTHKNIKDYFKEFVRSNRLKFSLKQWELTDSIFPGYWVVSVTLPSGEEYVAFGKTDVDALENLLADMKRIFLKA